MFIITSLSSLLQCSVVYLCWKCRR